MIGTGNVAVVLSGLFHQNGHEIVQVYGRDLAKAQALAAPFNCSYTNDPGDLVKTADLYLLAVSDDAINIIAQQLSLNDQLVVHSAGSVPANVLAKASAEYGVFYPLQSLRPGTNAQVPILIEASSETSQGKLETLARSIGSTYQVCSGSQRRQMHLAAVWVNNFPNLLYSIAYKICKENQVDFALLQPLLQETAERQNGTDPSKWQTGPAMRNDKNTLDVHLQLLEAHPEWQAVYRILSEEIRRING